MTRRSRLVIPLVATLAAVAALLAALWWWPGDEGGVKLASAAREAIEVQRAASEGQGGGVWGRLADASRAADAVEGPDPYCGMEDTMNELAPLISRNASREELEPFRQRHEAAMARDIEAETRRLRAAKDEMAQVLVATIDKDGARLTQLGQATEDPLVYGMALRNCTSVSKSCDGLSAQRWAELDPGNATAWWLIAADADDQPAAMAAMRQALRADHALSLVGLAAARIGADSPSPTLAQMRLGTLFQISVRNNTLPPVINALEAACGGENRPTDAATAAACRDMTLHAIATGPDLSDKFWATSFAQRHGLPDADLPYTNEQVRGMQQAMADMAGPEVSGKVTDRESALDRARQVCAETRQRHALLAQGAGIGDFKLFLHRGGRVPPRDPAAAAAAASASKR